MSLDIKMPDKVFGVELSLLKVFLLPVGLILLFLISFLLVIKPRYEEIGKIRKEDGEVVKKTKLVEEKRDYLLTVDEVELQRQSGYLDSALLIEKDAYLLVGVIRKVAKDNGYYIMSFNVSPGELSSEDESVETEVVNKRTVKNAVDRIPIGFTLAGPRETYLDFLIALEKTLPILSVNNFEMKVAGQVVKLIMKVSAHYVEDKSEFNVVEMSLAELMLSDEEQELIKDLSEFTDIGVDSFWRERESGFVEYDRPNPFSQ